MKSPEQRVAARRGTPASATTSAVAGGGGTAIPKKSPEQERLETELEVFLEVLAAARDNLSFHRADPAECALAKRLLVDFGRSLGRLNRAAVKDFEPVESLMETMPAQWDAESERARARP